LVKEKGNLTPMIYRGATFPWS